MYCSDANTQYAVVKERTVVGTHRLPSLRMPISWGHTQQWTCQWSPCSCSGEISCILQFACETKWVEPKTNKEPNYKQMNNIVDIQLLINEIYTKQMTQSYLFSNLLLKSCVTTLSHMFIYLLQLEGIKEKFLAWGFKNLSKVSPLKL